MNVIFYSSVSDKSLFNTQRFYYTDINILEKLGFNVVLSNSIWDSFKFWNYDIVFAYFYRFSLLFALIAKMFGRDTYFTGGIDALDTNSTKKTYIIQLLLFKLCYIVSKKCIIVSKTDLAHVLSIVGPSSPKIDYSEHSINTKLYIPGRKNNDFCTIGWMGSFENVKRKGMDKSIEFFAELKKYPKFSDSKLFVLGKEGEGTQILKSIISRANLEEDVIILGEVSEEEKISLLKTTRYYFQLSSYEGFGVAALEALFAGNIIIHSANGGLSAPIYEEHVIIDINTPLCVQVEKAYEQIISFNSNKINSIISKNRDYYDDCRRLADFKRIIMNDISL